MTTETTTSQAVVLGASMAGLLTARVLSEHFDRVTIIERDPVAEGPVSRKGQPQTRHLHGLLASGMHILSGYFPDLPDTLAAGRGRRLPLPAYLEVQVREPGEPDGVGRIVELFTKGWLPYTLRWRFRVTESRAPYGFTLEAWGDFVGRGVWTFVQEGAYVVIIYDWKIIAEKPVLKRLSFLLKPIFAANHRWAMARGEESLKLERLRRRARDERERAAIPAPPGPTFWSRRGASAT